MARPAQLAALLLLALFAGAAQAKTCARWEWNNVYAARNGRLVNDHARMAMRHIVHAVADVHALQARVGTVGCELVKYHAITGCNDNTPVLNTPARKALWFVKYRAAYDCKSGHKYMTIWAYTSTPSNPESVKVPQARPTAAW